MLTFLVFINFETQQQMIVARHPDADLCGKDIPIREQLYFPDGLPDRLYITCIETRIIGTSLIPRLR